MYYIRTIRRSFVDLFLDISHEYAELLNVPNEYAG